MHLHDVVVVGGGLFGQIIARELRSRGREVTVYDGGRPLAGSRPAACLMKPSWYSGLGAEVTDPALALLDRHYELRELPFRAGGLEFNVKWVRPRDILESPVVEANVTRVTEDGEFSLDEPDEPDGRAQTLVVAAGVWTGELTPVSGLRGQAGVAFVWPTPPCFQMTGRISPWAPYRQLVAFKRDHRELWVGDGSSIKASNWTPAHQTASRERCKRFVELQSDPALELVGIRPYVPGAKPCFLERRGRMWVATGGAKNGTIGAAWCAHMISKEEGLG